MPPRFQQVPPPNPYRFFTPSLRPRGMYGVCQEILVGRDPFRCNKLDLSNRNESVSFHDFSREKVGSSQYHSNLLIHFCLAVE